MPTSSCGPLRLFIVAATILATPARAQSPPPYLSLDIVLARAAAVDPTRPAAEARLAGAEAAVRQAAVRPTASLDLEVENFAGSGAYSVLDRTETTLTYALPWERGGKVEARVGQARAHVAVARLRAEARRLDLLREVQAAYAEALADEAELLVADARLIAAQASQRDIARRVKSARDPLFAGSRAQALTASAEVARDRAKTAARTSRAALAARWGGTADFNFKLDDFFNVQAPSGRAGGDTPDLALLEAERDVASAAVRLEQARGIPDPILRAGVRYFGDGRDVALVVGGSIPLGVHAANRGAVDRALAEREAAQQDIVTARAIRDREVMRLAAHLQALASESERIRTEVIPPAIRSVEQVVAGFNRGGFQYLDVNEAERLLADARIRRVEVLRQFHVGVATLDRLTGKHRALVTSNLQERR